VRRVESLPASQVGRKNVEWALPGRAAYGYLTLLIGEQGLGKSTWLAWVAAENSRRGAVTLVASAEDGWDTTIRPRLEACSANLDLVRFVDVALDDLSADGLLLPDDVDELAREIADTCATVVTIDPVLAHLGRDIDSHRDASTRQALAPLARLANEHGVAVIAAHHLNKSASSDPLSRAAASVAFTAQARSVLLWARVPSDDEGERGPQRALAHVKSNLSALTATQLWTVEPILLPAMGTHPEVETSRVVLTGESEHSGRDLLARREDTEPSALEEAREFLRQELATGPVPAKTIFGAAKTLGISEITLRRAAKDVGAETRKASFAGGWEWLIPLRRQDDHQRGSPSENGSDDHLGRNGSTMPVLAASEAPGNLEDDHPRELSIFGAMERARRFDELYPPKELRT
jgi:putative DNA primase/helicase